MGSGNHGWVSPQISKALAGIETGVLGGLAMFGCLAVSALVDSHSIWMAPNLLGSVLSGQWSLSAGFGWITVAGLGLHFSASGALGMTFGLLVGVGGKRLRVTLLGMLTGLVWYYFSQIFFRRKLGILMMLYSPPQTLLLAHLIYGLVLGWFPNGLRAVRRSFFPETAPAEIAETDAAPDAVE